MIQRLLCFILFTCALPLLACPTSHSQRHQAKKRSREGEAEAEAEGAVEKSTV